MIMLIMIIMIMIIVAITCVCCLGGPARVGALQRFGQQPRSPEPPRLIHVPWFHPPLVDYCNYWGWGLAVWPLTYLIAPRPSRRSQPNGCWRRVQVMGCIVTDGPRPQPQTFSKYVFLIEVG